MKKITSFSVSEEMLKEVDRHPITQEASRSATVRIAISEFLEKGKSEMREFKNENKEE